MADKPKPGCLSHLLAAVVMIVLAVWLLQKVQCNSSTNTSTTQPDGSPAASQPSQPAVDPQLQARRKALVQEMIDRGIFQKIERRGIRVEARATPLFAALDFDKKQDFAGVVYAWLHDSLNASERDLASVAILDSKTGKEIGNYDRGWTGELKLRMK